MAVQDMQVRLGVQDNGYSSGIKSAKDTLESLNKEFGVGSAKIRPLSTQVSQAKKAFNDLTLAYEQLDDKARGSKFGEAMAQQIEIAKRKAQELIKIQNEARESISGSGSNKGNGFMSQVLNKSGFGEAASMLSNFSSMSGKAAMGAAAIGTGVGVAVAAVQGFSDALSNNIETAMKFEKSVSAVKALTGASADAMETLKNKAIELGGSTTQTASQVMDAFGMIGSKKPELLSDADALGKVTEYSIMLSEAAGIQLSDAATATTGVLNQFGLSASKAKDVVNLLAAASQQGAGDIPYLSQAIVNCGSVAGSLGVSVEETTSQLEMLAQAGVDASSAGNQMKNILLILESSTDRNLRPSVVGLNEAIKNLADKNYDAASMAKLFGRENVAAALTLAKMSSKADELTNSITGTNTAEEQQRINNDNLDGSLKNLESKWEAFNLAINEGNGLIRSCVDLTANLVGWFTKLITKTDAATESRKRFNKELNGSNADPKGGSVSENVDRVKNQKDKKGMVRENNRIMRSYRKTYQNYTSQINGIDKRISQLSATSAGKSDNLLAYSQGTMLSTLQRQRAELVKERNELAKQWNDFRDKSVAELNLGPVNGRKKGNGNGTSNGNGTVSTKTTNVASGKSTIKDPLTEAQKKYAADLLKIDNKEKVGYIDAQKAEEERLASINRMIEAYIDASKGTNKYEKEISALNAQLKLHKNTLKILEDESIIAKADKEYKESLEKFAREKAEGLIDETEYQSSLIDATRTLVKKYNGVSTLSEELKGVIGSKVKEIKDYDIEKAQQKTVEKNEKDRQSKLKAKIDYKRSAVETTRGYGSNDYFKKKSFFPFKSFDADKLVDAVTAFNQNKYYENYAKTAKASGGLGSTVVTILDDKHAEEYNSIAEKALEGFKEIMVKNGEVNANRLEEYLNKQGVSWEDFYTDKAFKDFREDKNTKLKTLPEGYKGDETNYRNNFTPFHKIQEKATFNEPQSKFEEQQQKLQELMGEYETLQNKANEALMNGYILDDSDLKVFDELEKEIDDLSEKVNAKLKFKVTISNMGEVTSELGKFGSELSYFSKFGENISEATTALDKFVVVMNTFSSVFETVNTVMGIWNTLQTLFAAKATVSAGATTSQAAAQAAKAAADTAGVPLMAANTVAAKAQEAAYLDLASAQIFAAHAAIPFAGVGIATGLITEMMTAMAAQHAASLTLAAFANGGIIGGSNFVGDQNIVRVNSGEMILNHGQQANLFNLLDGASGTGGGFGKVEFEISGQNLKGVLNNYNKKTSKIK